MHNDAFVGEPIAEVQYLFDQCINAIESGLNRDGYSRKLVDSNGNSCGLIAIGQKISNGKLDS